MSNTMAVVRVNLDERPFTMQQAAGKGSARSGVPAGRLLPLGRTGNQGVPDSSSGFPEGPAEYGKTQAAYLDRVRLAARRHPQATFSHDSAAALYGLWCPWIMGWREVTATMPSASGPVAGARIIRRSIDEQDITMVAGIRCTTPARTALDIAAQATLAEALVVIDSYGRLGNPVRKQTLDPAFRTTIRHELLLAAIRMRGVHGIDRARYASALANPAAESAPASYARGLLIANGYPEPDVGRPIRGSDGRTYRAALCWPRRRLIVAIDGRGSDLTSEDQDAIRTAGWAVHRVLADRLWTDPDRVRADLEESWAA